MGRAFRRTAWTAVLVAGSASIGGLVTLAAGLGEPEWLFFSVCLAFLAVLCRAAAVGLRQVRRQQLRAEALARVRVGEVAASAVRAERRRLSADITAQLRTLMAAVLEAAEDTHVDSRERARKIHGQAQQATAELRRQLGLLRDVPLPSVGSADEHHPRRTHTVALADLLAGAGLAALAAGEAWLHPRSEGLEPAAAAMVTTALAAAAVVALRRSSTLVAAWVTTTITLGLLVGAPVVLGFWTLGAIAAPLWKLAARMRGRPAELLAVSLLVVATSTTALRHDPQNASVMIAIMLLAMAGGVVVRALGHRARSTQTWADMRAAVLADARAAALADERTAYAQEIHDVISHAVGLIAVQAAAAQVSWPERPSAGAAAFVVIADTARATLAELDRLLPPSRPGRAVRDFEELIDRVRAAGTAVRATGLAEIPDEFTEVIYRILQESLTNVLRHAGGAAAVVSVISTGQDLVVSIDDEGQAADSAVPRGYGLTGLGERVAYAGGSVSAGLTSTGGFRVTAQLPLRAQARQRA